MHYSMLLIALWMMHACLLPVSLHAGYCMEERAPLSSCTCTFTVNCFSRPRVRNINRDSTTRLNPTTTYHSIQEELRFIPVQFWRTLYSYSLERKKKRWSFQVLVGGLVAAFVISSTIECSPARRKPREDLKLGYVVTKCCRYMHSTATCMESSVVSWTNLFPPKWPECPHDRNYPALPHLLFIHQTGCLIVIVPVTSSSSAMSNYRRLLQQVTCTEAPEVTKHDMKQRTLEQLVSGSTHFLHSCEDERVALPEPRCN